MTFALQATSEFQIFCACFAIFLAIGHWLRSKKLYKNINKEMTGPPGWPIFGNFFMLDSKKPYLTFYEWSKTYGPVYMVQLVREKTLLLNDAESINEALGGKFGAAFSGRPYIPAMDAYQDGRHGVANADGPVWQQHRRFALTVLRQFGSGSSLMTERVHEESIKLISVLKSLCNQQGTIDRIDPVPLINSCVANVICSILIGQTFEYDNEEFVKFQNYMNEFFQNAAKSMPVQYFPLLQYIVPGNFGLGSVRRNFQYIRDCFLQPYVDKQKAKLIETKDADSSAENIIEAYLKELSRLNEADSIHTFCERELLGVISDLFVGGQHTTTTTLAWALLHMVHYPEVQSAVQREIDEKIGKLPTWEDRQQLPYTQACITEIMRVRTLAPVGLLHACVQDVEFRGLRVPKGATVIPNIWAANNDPRIFSNPEEFNPNRFLDKNTGALTGTEKVLAFSSGKRVCLGESMARVELFHSFTSLLYHFTFQSIDERKLPSLESIPGIVEQPFDYEVRVLLRKN